MNVIVRALLLPWIAISAAAAEGVNLNKKDDLVMITNQSQPRHTPRMRVPPTCSQYQHDGAMQHPEDSPVFQHGSVVSF